MNLSDWKHKNNVPTNKKLIEKTLLYIDNKDWYTNSLKAITNKYGVHTDKFIKLLGVTSPRNTVKRNLFLADKTLKYSILDKDIDFSYGLANGQIKRNVDKVLNNRVIGGQKVNAFIKALSGDLKQIVIDSWMLKAFNINRQSPLKNDIVHIKEVIDKISIATGLEPSQVQACLWCYSKVELNDSPFKEDNDFSFYMQQTRLNDFIIKEK